MTNKQKASAILNDMSLQALELNHGIQGIASLLELSYSQARDLTDVEMDKIYSLRLENKPKHKENVIRSVIY
jgi:hypothetical protein